MVQRKMLSESKWEICASALKENDALDKAFQGCRGLFPFESVQIFQQYDDIKTKRLIQQAWRSERQRVSAEDHDSFVLSTWRFMPDSIQQFLDVLPSVDGNKLFLGAPTLLYSAQGMFSTGSDLLIDIVSPENNPKNVPVLNYDIGNLSGKEFLNKFQMCFLDPPWYLGPLKHWLTVASKSVKEGGIVAFPLLQELTRPTGLQDRKSILEFLEKIGLGAKVYQNVVLYQPPSFERAILQRIGLPAVCWKRADLVVCQKMRRDVSEYEVSPTIMPPLKRVQVGKVTFDIVFDRHDEDSEEIVLWRDTEYWMHTPSRRDRFNAECNVFTSNGARFVSPKPFDLFQKIYTARDGNIGKLQGIIPDDLLFECGGFER